MSEKEEVPPRVENTLQTLEQRLKDLRKKWPEIPLGDRAVIEGAVKRFDEKVKQFSLIMNLL